jgi:predicted NBD/HSP70 family sugar kinase
MFTGKIRMEKIHWGKPSIAKKKKTLLHFIYKSGTISTSDLCTACRINIVTAYRLLDSLATEGLITVQRDDKNQNVGRPSNMLSINRDYLYLMAVYIRRTMATIALVDFSNHIVQEEETPLLRNEAPEALLAKLEKIYPALLEKQHIQNEKIAGIGISCIGPLEKTQGMLRQPPFFNHFWDNYPIVEKMEKLFHKNAILDFNACSATMGKYANRMMPKDENLAYIIIDEGIGSAVILNNLVPEGTSKTILSLAHTTVDVNGKKCFCGKYGCIEQYATETAMLEAALLELRLGKKSLLQKYRDTLTFDHICAAVRRGDRLAESVIENAAAYFSAGLCNYASILDIKTVYLGGSMVNRCPSYYTFAQDRLRELVPELKVHLERNLKDQILKGISTKYLLYRLFEQNLMV